TKATEEGYAALALPTSIRELVGRRLEDLSVEARALARAASVLGRVAEVSLLQEMMQLGQERVDEALAELMRRQVLEGPEPPQVRFVQDKIREVAYEQLDAGSRQRLHRRAAEAISALPESERHERLAELGAHWEQAGEQARARECYLAGAQDATERSA